MLSPSHHTHFAACPSARLGMIQLYTSQSSDPRGIGTLPIEKVEQTQHTLPEQAYVIATLESQVVEELAAKRRKLNDTCARAHPVPSLTNHLQGRPGRRRFA
ncbi:hypothetical protein HBH69_225560 [Parastagonospora nodorum]|nr:hypothetical protein HBH69_225560 [Parastagonospora nodorum]KAH5526968.1 hypothetical protein HBI27_239780 [Parastagonospora nodorum]